MGRQSNVAAFFHFMLMNRINVPLLAYDQSLRSICLISQALSTNHYIQGIVMKKILAAATLSMVMFPAAQALADQDIGCGLGTMIFEGKSGLAPKVLGATTNGISGNQSFGITFGTLAVRLMA